MDKQLIVMIVDDDLDDIDFFCEALSDNFPACLILKANNGEDALAKLRKAENPVPNLIFLDLNMPRMDGKTCLSHLKKDVILKRIPVVVYSTSNSQKDKEVVIDLGAAHVMLKPVSYSKLCDQLSSVITSLI